MKCFYHGVDLDGHCAGAIIKIQHPGCWMVPVDYHDRVAFPEPDNGETVFVVDFSFPANEMMRLHDKCNLIWIDHHKTAIADVAGIIGGIRKVGEAGCELTWRYLFRHSNLPNAVRLLGRYDVWDHTDPDVLPFQYGMRLVDDTHPGATIWNLLLRREWGFQKRKERQILEQGKIAFVYQQQQNEKYARTMAYETEFEGLRAVVMNKPLANSLAFDRVFDPRRHDIMVAFGVNEKNLKYSLYTNKPDVDVSLIAKKYGGGGHAGAAGFYSETRVV